MATIGRILLIPKGDYNGTTVYNMLDWVRHSGSAWVCKVNGTVGILPPTLPTTSNANWQLLASDGSVSGGVAWAAITGKPFDGVGNGLNVDGSNNIELDISMLTGSNISYDNSSSGLSASDIQNAIDELAGSSTDISWNQIQGATGGTKIAEIEIDGVTQDVYAPTGGSGGSSTFAGLDDTDITNPQPDEIVQYKAIGGQMKLQNVPMPQGGHTMIPTPDASLTENDVVKAINAATGTNENVPSLFSIREWTNEKKVRRVMTGTTSIGGASIGSTGIGKWDDSASPDESTWWYDAAFKIPDNRNDIDLSLKFDPSSGEPITLGGYILDTDTGKLCIKFGNSIATPANAKIAVDITYTRNEFS